MRLESGPDVRLERERIEVASTVARTLLKKGHGRRASSISVALAILLVVQEVSLLGLLLVGLEDVYALLRTASILLWIVVGIGWWMMAFARLESRLLPVIRRVLRATER